MFDGTYGSAMNFTSGTPSSSNLTASYNATSGKLSLVCAGDDYLTGLVAALVYEPELTPPTYTLQWVDDSDATLPAGSNKTSLVPMDGGIVSTVSVYRPFSPLARLIDRLHVARQRDLQRSDCG